jgi:iron complex transport system substrate-binding protein
VRNSSIVGSLILLVCIGCERAQMPNGPNPVDSTSTASVETTSTRVITDRLGRSISFESVPTKIVSLSPATTELLFALGAGPSIVGATKHCDYPSEAKSIPRVGSGTLEGISRESILNVEPDLILCKFDNHQPLVESFEAMGFKIVGLGPESLEEMFEEATLLGRILHREKEAVAFIESMKLRSDRLQERVAGIQDGDRVRVFYEVWDQPLMTAGPKSFIGELLVLARTVNIFNDVSQRYPKVSIEVVVDRNPQVILCPTTHGRPVEIETVLARSSWQSIEAIQNRRVHLIDGDQVSRCGPRLLDALESMIDAVYPLPAGVKRE